MHSNCKSEFARIEAEKCKLFVQLSRIRRSFSTDSAIDSFFSAGRSDEGAKGCKRPAVLDPLENQPWWMPKKHMPANLSVLCSS